MITYKRMLDLISVIYVRTTTKCGYFLLVQMTFSGENDYVAHTSKKNNLKNNNKRIIRKNARLKL